MSTDTATYSPEDNKLRLYVGRVPRDEYLKLRAEGWTSTPKQDCDFVATWTPQRRDTCLQYAELIEDEDQGPEDRAADRAERFGEYRDKRTGEATGHADNYDAGPIAHGYQSQARAERSARRHDRQASYACDAWGKAEYWQQRTAGVIRHALYKSTPSVRMGRIKVLEAELRGMVQRWQNSGSEPTGWAADWKNHLELRLSYENQMLEAQGGRAAFVEMIPGGFVGKFQIHKVNKSTATGRVVSVSVKVPKVQSWTYKTTNVTGQDYALSQIDTERLPADAYRAPTDPELEAFNAERKAEKAARPVTKSLLINPTDADAERLQAIWNAEAAKRDKRDTCTPQTPLRITQAQYSANSGGTYSALETIEISEHGTERRTSIMRGTERARVTVCKVRRAPSQRGDNSTSWYNAQRVVIITDKPQKPLPFAEMEALRATLPNPENMRPRIPELKAALAENWLNKTNTGVLNDGAYCGWVSIQSMSQISLTEAGRAAFAEYDAAPIEAEICGKRVLIDNATATITQTSLF